jgi:DNA repair protein RadA
VRIREVKIEGVGDATIKKLEDAGITELEDLVAADPAELAKLLAVTVHRAKKIVNSAKEVLLESEVLVETADTVEKFLSMNIVRIPTGSKELDKLLGGGVPTRAITTLVGQHATGKSQLCFQLAANVMDKGEYVGFVETEPSTFMPGRVRQICEARGLRYDPEKLLVIRAEKVTSPEKQLLAYEAIWRKARRENLPLRLLIVDSFSARLRAAYTGREMLSARSQETARHIGLLEIIAGERNCAVVPDCSRSWGYPTSSPSSRLGSATESRTGPTVASTSSTAQPTYSSSGSVPQSSGKPYSSTHRTSRGSRQPSR